MFLRPEIEQVMEYSRVLGLRLTATEARIIHSRLLEEIDVMEAFSELRIQEHRPPLRFAKRDPGWRPLKDEDPLNAFITKCHIEGSEDGPLEGKTIGMKDHISVAGVPLTFGSHFMEGYIPEFDATIVTRVLEAGATITGKMNMEDFSFGGPGFAGVGDFGRPLNPHDIEYVTGGSSSGSAAAVAGRYIDIAFGGDQGGSIRIPAAWCGVVGLKATYGLIPHTGVFGIEPTLDFVGPLARTVEDIAVVTECVAGPDGYDPRQINLPKPLPSYTETLNHGIDSLRVGILSEGFINCERDVKEIVFKALDILEQNGISLKEVSVPLHIEAQPAVSAIVIRGVRHLFDTNFGGAFSKTFYPTSLITTVGRFKNGHGHELPPNLKELLIAGEYFERLYSGRLYAKAQNIRPTVVKAYDEAFRQVDILAMPTVPVRSHIYHEPSDYEDAYERTLYGGQLGQNNRLNCQNTSPFNLTGHPAISVPCVKPDGMPVGLMLVAPFFREDLLLRAAYAYQESVDWDSLFPKETQAKKA